MDEQRFDQLSRRLGASRTRRQALRAFAGAVVASISGVNAANATIIQPCIAKNRACQGDGQCCSGMVCEYGMCRAGCRIDGEFALPNKSPFSNTCMVCNPAVSTTSGQPTREGKTCWSGDPYAGQTTCQSGICRNDEPISCPPLTVCHLEGTANPSNGLCEYPPAPEGTPCGTEAMCHGRFYSPAAECDGNGTCVAGGSRTEDCAPYLCLGSACATSCTSDADCTNGAVCCGTICTYLNTTDYCGSCDNPCSPADACSPTLCDNGVCNEASICVSVDACTPAACISGACNETTACMAVDACTPAACNNGVCNETSACTAVDSCTPAACNNGACNQVSTCTPIDTCTPASCSNGVCNQTSACIAPEHGTTRCSSGECQIICDQGYKLDQSGKTCELVPLCPEGYQALNGGCFLIVNTIEERRQCADIGCNWFGSVEGTGAYLCGGTSTVTQCAHTSDCPGGTFCSLDFDLCMTNCPNL